jgi:hypothetical protein
MTLIDGSVDNPSHHPEKQTTVNALFCCFVFYATEFCCCDQKGKNKNKRD